jgi:hypothetical protein
MRALELPRSPSALWPGERTRASIPLVARLDQQLSEDHGEQRLEP